MKYDYARVSTNEQELAYQLEQFWKMIKRFKSLWFDKLDI